MTAKYSKDEIVVRFAANPPVGNKPPDWVRIRKWYITEVYSMRHKVYMVAPIDSELCYEDKVAEYSLLNKADYARHCLEWEHNRLLSVLKHEY